MPTTENMISVRIFWMPKDGHTTSEYEDAYATSDPEQLPFRAAVADGATESAFSGPWARRLTSAFCQSGDLENSLEDLREGFHRISRRRPLPWYLEEKSEEGSHAAFAGIEIDEEEEGTRRWTAQAIGDCCVLQLRDGDLVLSWPLSDPDAFNSTPNLISSRQGEDEPSVPSRTGQWLEGDRFILATDALAAYFLEHGVADGSLHEVVEEARKAGSLKNDDVTAIIIDV